jgi:hypothetical protein
LGEEKKHTISNEERQAGARAQCCGSNEEQKVGLPQHQAQKEEWWTEQEN